MQPPPKAAEPAHLTDALRRAGVLGTGRVAQVTVERSFATILSHLFRLRLTYDGATADAPPTAFLKAGLAERPGGPWMGGRHEVAFYRDVAPALPPGIVPRCFDHALDQADGTWHLLLEDLSETHATPSVWPLPPALDRCEAVIRTHARFQAALWDDPRLGTSIGTWEHDAAIDQSLSRAMADYARFADALGDRLSPARRDLYARLFDAAPRLATRYRSRRHMTVIQGDAHVWNCMLLKDGVAGSPRLFDWDAWRLEVGTTDLAYMMALHWYPDFRKHAERHLLDCFHDELLKGGVQGYDRRMLQDDYRLSALWQLTTPVWQHAHGIPPVIWWNHLERIHAAVDDLGSLEFLAG